MKKIFLLMLSIIFLAGCLQKREPKMTNKPKAGKINRKADIILDSIYLEHIGSSYNGYLHVDNDSIYFIDSRFGWVFIFNLEGEFLTRHLGQGRGPKEISTKSISSFCFLRNGERLFLGSSLDYYIFDNSWNMKNKFIIDLTCGNKFKPNKLSYENPLTYTWDYEHLVIRSDPESKYIFIPLYAERKRFNPYVENYYKKSRILEKVKIRDGKILSLMGRRSSEYLKYNYVGQYSFFSFDISDKGYFYITHEIDSLVYVFDKKYKLIETFGNSGYSMNTDYTELDHLDRMIWQKLYLKERPKHGYYSYLEYIDETSLLFRSYTKSGLSAYDGLQIYKDNILIADLNVPKNFKVIGYNEPYYYSGAFIDEENEKIMIYRFVLKN